MKINKAILLFTTTCCIYSHANLINGAYKNGTPRNASTAPIYQFHMDYSQTGISGTSSVSGGPYGGSVNTSYQDGQGTIAVTTPSNSQYYNNFTYQQSVPTGTFSISGNTIETPYGNYYTIPSNSADFSNGTLTTTVYGTTGQPQTIVFYGPNSTQSSSGNIIIVDQTSGQTIGEISHEPGEITYTSDVNTTIAPRTLYYTVGTVTGSDGKTYNAVAYSTSQGNQGIILVDPNTGYIKETSIPEEENSIKIYNAQTGNSLSYYDEAGSDLGWNVNKTGSAKSFGVAYGPGVNSFTITSDQGTNLSGTKDSNDYYDTQGYLGREENPYISNSQYSGGMLSIEAEDPNQLNTMEGQLYYYPSSDSTADPTEVGSYTRTYSLSSGSSPTLTINTDITSYYKPNTNYDFTMEYTPDTGSTSYTTQYGDYTLTRPTGTFNLSNAAGNSLSWSNNEGTISYDYTSNGNTIEGTAYMTWAPNQGVTITGSNQNSLSFLNGVFYYNGEPFYYDPATQSLIGYYGNSMKVGQ